MQAYGRAIDLDPARLFSLVQSGTILLSLGSASAGLERHRQALAAAPAHVPGLCGAAETLLALAKMHSTQGATGEHVQSMLLPGGHPRWQVTQLRTEHLPCAWSSRYGLVDIAISMGSLDTDKQLLMF